MKSLNCGSLVVVYVIPFTFSNTVVACDTIRTDEEAVSLKYAEGWSPVYSRQNILSPNAPFLCHFLNWCGSLAIQNGLVN